MDETGDQSAPAEVEVENQSAPSGQSELDKLFDGETPVAEGEQLEAEVDPDEEDVEYEGDTYRLPKKLRDAVLRQKDYTQKTQALADERRQYEERQTQLQSEQQQFQQAVQRQQANLKAYAQVAAIDQRLEQYSQVNWQQLNAENPGEANRLWFDYQQAKDARGTLVNQISHSEQQMALQQQQQAVRLLEQGRTKLASEIKDWSPEKQHQLLQYGKKAGYADNELANIQDHRAILILHKAFQYDQMMEKASKKPPAAAPAVAPLRVVKAGNASGVNPDSMSMDDWARHERARVAKKRS